MNQFRTADKSEPSGLLKVAPFRKEIRKTEPHKHNSYLELVYLSAGSGIHTLDHYNDKVQSPVICKNRYPQSLFFALIVGMFELICGTLVLIGLCTRLAAIPLLVIMLVTIANVKARLLADNVFWSMLHDSRTDWSMPMGYIFLILKGGRYSLDRKLCEA